MVKKINHYIKNLFHEKYIPPFSFIEISLDKWFMDIDLRNDNNDDDLKQKNREGVKYFIWIRKIMNRTSLNILNDNNENLCCDSKEVNKMNFVYEDFKLFLIVMIIIIFL